jgi:hypothetical protein
VDLHDRFDQQEQTAADEDQIAPGNLLGQHSEKRCGEPHHPGEHEQQGEAGEHGKTQAQHARPLALLRRQPENQDGDEDNVVHPEHDFENGQGDECYPCLG